jgi:hypothetical protein
MRAAITLTEDVQALEATTSNDRMKQSRQADDYEETQAWSKN